jgi:peptidyl-prolyl cis-trans isomerase A (cyclophilin A)
LYPESDPVAPDTFTVVWNTTVSTQPIVLEVIREWSPLGVDRFYQLIQDNYYDCAAFFRVVPDFIVQFGIASDPNETEKWSTTVPDDPVLESNLYSYVSFATAGNNTRTAQLFINTADNSHLDALGFSPFGRIIEGMGVVLAVNIYDPRRIRTRILPLGTLGCLLLTQILILFCHQWNRRPNRRFLRCR